MCFEVDAMFIYYFNSVKVFKKELFSLCFVNGIIEFVKYYIFFLYVY